MTSSNGDIFRVTGHLCSEFPAQRPVTRSFDVFFDLRLNKSLSKQWGSWFETLSRPLWRHRNALRCIATVKVFSGRVFLTSSAKYDIPARKLCIQMNTRLLPGAAGDNTS